MRRIHAERKPMSDLQAIADRVEIEALRGEFTDAVMMSDYDRLLMHGRDGNSQLNYSVYHDRYQRTPDGWKFVERVYEVRYLDTTPLAGSAPDAGMTLDGSTPSEKRRLPEQKER
jgi:hypothetical protein